MNITEETGINELIKTIQKIESKIIEWQKNYKKEKLIFNIEAIPGESMCVKLCEIDTHLKLNPNGYKIYSNQYIPLIDKATIHDRFKVQGQIDNLTSGGAILHINVNDEKALTPTQFKMLMNAARESKTVYFAINYAFSECENHHFSIKRDKECSICKGKIINTYTRVVGFLTSINTWSKTRREYEYQNRYFYSNGEIAS